MKHATNESVQGYKINNQKIKTLRCMLILLSFHISHKTYVPKAILTKSVNIISVLSNHFPELLYSHSFFL